LDGRSVRRRKASPFTEEWNISPRPSVQLRERRVLRRLRAQKEPRLPPGGMGHRRVRLNLSEFFGRRESGNANSQQVSESCARQILTSLYLSEESFRNCLSNKI
jgi:hypothetical protein